MTEIGTRSVTGAALDALADGFRGELVTPDHPGYEDHRRVWNGSIDRRPALIARCAGVADVIAAVRFGRERALPVAVRSGGHSFPGLSVVDDGLVVDLSLMRGTRVDPAGATVRAQAGVLLGELDHETQAFGLAVPSGIVTHTGIAGLTLGGGIGWLMRKHGLTIDRLRSVDLVTAAGDLVHADAEENPDLFWGVRGGGGNFGIVTEFEYALERVGPIVLAGPTMWEVEHAGSVMRFYRDWIAEAPDELMTMLVLRRAPTIPAVPPEIQGRRVVVVVSCYAGDVADGERVLAPLRAHRPPLLDLCRPQPYLAHQALLDPSFRPGWSYYVRSHDLAGLTDPVVDIFAEMGPQVASPITSVGVFHLGGAVARVPAAATAFGGRDSGHTVNINGNAKTPEDFDAERDWARRFSDALAPHAVGAYSNFLMEEGQDRVRRSYGANFGRLQELKRRWDPDNVFRLNQNIPPAA
ncbi:FAD-binding oxidoreductase [Georgenia yuyongxinii]|uniref:FAD-binding oxidoreductase n=1 Tax=Georgenia yuyongxinii TaxID=2589797 RepID=A0A5B8C5F5_9MICO|nr:FAD-binding oxidoreductase [Georgenia yuyongxinii]QDC25290.1 FAD-binding oxidoreductase [Georgenia yuyongxinii]